MEHQKARNEEGLSNHERCHWNSLPHAAADSPSLVVSKEHLDQPPVKDAEIITEQGLGADELQGASQLQHSIIFSYLRILLAYKQ